MRKLTVEVRNNCGVWEKRVPNSGHEPFRDWLPVPVGYYSVQAYMAAVREGGDTVVFVEPVLAGAVP